jgi:phospholipid/cholesterol/gamma-HCH transport system ATP-binding protein
VYSELEPDEKENSHRNWNGFQGSALFDSMTVEENVSLKMFTNDNKAVLKERVDFVLERVALTDAHNKLPSQISGMQNVCIARYCQQA